jgi:hypothetical protein
MNNHHPYPAQEAVIPIGVAIILTIVTCGLYGFWWQYKQMEILNAWLGRKEYDFWTYILLTLITCGFFAVYYEYKMAQGINEIQHNGAGRVNENLALICLLLTIFGLGIVSLAIQQADINDFYGNNPDI